MTAIQSVAHTPSDTRSEPRPSGRARRLLTHVAIIALGLVMIYPLMWMLSASFRTDVEIFNASGLWPEQFVWSNYRDGWFIFEHVTFGRFFLNSLIVAVGSVVGNLIACSMAAYAFARLEFRFKRVLFVIMLGTIMLPYHVQIIPQYIAFLQLDWINTFYPLILPKFLATDAFFIFLMVQFIRGLPRELDYAAAVDGCGFFGVFWRIIIPLSLPALVTTAIFTFIFTWNDFFSPLLYLTRSEMWTVPLGLRAFVDAEGNSSWGPLMAMSVLSLAPILGFFLASQRLLVHGIATTGLK